MASVLDHTSDLPIELPSRAVFHIPQRAFPCHDMVSGCARYLCYTMPTIPEISLASLSVSNGQIACYLSLFEIVHPIHSTPLSVLNPSVKCLKCVMNNLPVLDVTIGSPHNFRYDQ